MSYCVFPGYSNRNTKKRKNYQQNLIVLRKRITFHTFPRNAIQKQKWLEALNLMNWEPARGSGICSEHFPANSFIYMSETLTRLKKSVIPHLMVNSEDHYSHNINHMKNDMNNSYIEDNYVSDSKHLILKSEDTDATFSKNNETKSVITIASTSNNTKSQPCIIDKTTLVSPKRILNSPIKKSIRDHYKLQIRKLYNINLANKRKQMRVESLTKALKILRNKKYVDDQQLQVLKYLGEDTEDLFKRCIQKTHLL